MPPRQSAAVVALSKFLVPIVLNGEGLSVRATRNCIETLAKLRDVQTVIVPNHPDRFDPLTIFTVSKYCNERFYYAAARETFDEDFRGWLFHGIGAYSVMRGAHDVTYLNATVKLLANDRCKLVVFAEGGVTGRDDSIEPLKSDVFAPVLFAQKHSGPRSLCILPVAIYYRVDPNATDELKKVLAKLETALDLQFKEDDLEHRTVALCERTLSCVEIYYGVTNVDEESSFEERVANLISHVARLLAPLAVARADVTKSDVQILRFIASQFRKPPWLSHLSHSPYSARLAAFARDRSEVLAHDFNRLERIVMISNALQQQPSLESLWRIIDCLEQEVLGKYSWKGERRALVDAAEPIFMSDFQTDSHRDKHEALDQLATTVHSSLQKSLDNLRATALDAKSLHTRERVEF